MSGVRTGKAKGEEEDWEEKALEMVSRKLAEVEELRKSDPQAGPTPRRDPWSHLAVSLAAGAVGVLVGSMWTAAACAASCAEGEYSSALNPIAAYFALRRIQANPIVSMLNPGTGEQAGQAAAGLLSVVVGGVGLLVRGVKSEVRKGSGGGKGKIRDGEKGREGKGGVRVDDRGTVSPDSSTGSKVQESSEEGGETPERGGKPAYYYDRPKMKCLSRSWDQKMDTMTPPRPARKSRPGEAIIIREGHGSRKEVRMKFLRKGIPWHLRDD
jgi:hypothetical protein